LSCVPRPVLFLIKEAEKFRLKPELSSLPILPNGTFTLPPPALLRISDRDGWLDIYFCLYAYYQGTDHTRYPMPYYEAENWSAPKFHDAQQSDGTFRERHRQSGSDQNNTRFSFCCSWGDYNGRSLARPLRGSTMFGAQKPLCGQMASGHLHRRSREAVWRTSAPAWRFVA